MILPLHLLIARRRIRRILPRNLHRRFQPLRNLGNLVRTTKRQSRTRNSTLNQHRHPRVILNPQQRFMSTLSANRPNIRRSHRHRMQITHKIRQSSLSAHKITLNQLMRKSTSRNQAIIIAPTSPYKHLTATHRTLMQIRPLINSNHRLEHILRRANSRKTNRKARLMKHTYFRRNVTIALRRQRIHIRTQTKHVTRQLKRRKNMGTLLRYSLLSSRPRNRRIINHNRHIHMPRISLLLPKTALIITRLSQSPRKLRRHSNLTTGIMPSQLKKIIRMPMTISQLRKALTQNITRRMRLSLKVNVRNRTRIHYT